MKCIIDEKAVEAAGGLVHPDACGLSLGGWSFVARRGPIAHDADAERLKDELGVISIPEQWYDSNLLEITHQASGTQLSFSARDALREWRAADEVPVRVPAAAEWMRSRKHEVETHNAKRIEYDWTFSTPYSGTVRSQHGQAPEWTGTRDQMDRSLLTNRDAILFFDDLPLYESELEDHGTSQLSVKVRVMPKCWYVLLRFFLRVDGVLVRLRETRVFGLFGSAAAQVLREVRHHEGSFEELRAGGAPPEGAAYADGDTAATALQAVAPVGVTRYAMEALAVPAGRGG